MEPDSLSNILSPFLQGLLVATGIGLIIGLEREFSTHKEESHLAGIRAFPLISIFGYTSAVVAKSYQPGLLVAVIAGFFVLTSVAYYVQTQREKLSLTTSLALLLSFLLGIFTHLGYFTDALAVAVVVVAILSLKEKAHGFIRQITTEELYAFVKFFVLALLLLPFLPDKNFGPENLLNARNIGWIVVIVSSISFAGYLMLKFYGLHKGILMMAVIGGLYSSTMVAWVFSARSREVPGAAATYAAGAVLSSSIMFLRVMFLVFVFNSAMAGQLVLPCIILAMTSGLCVWYISRQDKSTGETPDFPLGNPLDLMNALFFVGLYFAVTYFTFYSRAWFGTRGAYTSGAIAGITDMDAITINTANWATDASRYFDAINIILIAMLANSVFKASVCMVRGNSVFRKWVLVGFSVVLVVGLALLLFRIF